MMAAVRMPDAPAPARAFAAGSGRAARIRTADDAVSIARTLAAQIAEGAAERDRTRTLPFDQVTAIASSGLLAIGVPVADGGPGLPASTAAEVFRILAAADPNVAQIIHSHMLYTQVLVLAGSPEQRQTLLGGVVGGMLMANAQSERSGATAKAIATTLTATGDGLELSGTKYYCTGSMFADVIPVLARLDDPSSAWHGEEMIAYVARSAEGLAVVDDWNGMGQRTTASGTVTLDRVAVRPEQVVRRAVLFERPQVYGAFAQLLHTAIDVGIARGALDEAARFVRTSSRPWFEAQVETAAEDPLVIQRFGELYVQVAGAESALVSAAAAVDRAAHAATRPGDSPGRASSSETEELVAAASLGVAVAKVLGETAAVGVSSALFEVSGTRSAGGDGGLDRYWRNARTHTLHDPVRWKYHHLGAFALSGTLPPRHSAI